jgi:hypothetical protein
MTRRETALEILQEVPKGEPGIRSDKQPDEFHRLTGITHNEMLKSWRANPNGPKLYTACGGFAGKYAGRLGISGLENIFELQSSLISAGKAHAWVPASGAATPKPGDILRHKAYHVDVAAGWVNKAGEAADEWSKDARLVRVAAGQSYHPRPAKNVENEFDAVKWVTGTDAYNPAKLEGWLDLDLFFAAAPVVDATLSWLLGWWKVWDGNTYYYYFGKAGTVQYTKTPPAGNGPPAKPNNRGSYTLTADTLVITWAPLGGPPTVETFGNAFTGAKLMNGTSNKYSPLVAKRI